MLPIDSLRGCVLDQVAQGPVVVSAPTGSGKSTQVPRWLRSRGRVLVVEPRRVACQSLAARVAELEATPLGEGVGYAVRDERRASEGTEVLFVTPGVALRMVASGDHRSFTTLVLDEFHERPLDLDLLLALALRDRDHGPELVVMSATLEGDRVAAHLGGLHLSGEGRLHPVRVRHVPGRNVMPDARGLEERVRQALDLAGEDSGDVLVFLPGRREIASVASALGPHTRAELVELHGRLPLREQARVFKPGQRRRIVLSTNVAETSLTLPRIGVVIDSGLVRRTRYRKGRGSLALLPIARDSAEQRAGRAGRLGPGVCYRLWAEQAPLDPITPPEIHREDLTELVLAAASCDATGADLPYLDPPKGHAIERARTTLTELGALGDSGRLTDRGRRLFGLPLDAALGRLLLEAIDRETLRDVLPLVAALTTPRRLFAGRPDAADLDLRDAGCDATALIRAVREGRPGPHELDRDALASARRTARRLASALNLPPVPIEEGPTSIDRRALAETLLAAWPRCAHIARRRKRRVAWAGGSTELELGRDSCVDEQKAEALLVLDLRQIGLAARKDRLVITAAMPVPVAWLAAAGLGRERLGTTRLEGGQIVARIERVLAGRVLQVREEEPLGLPLREAVRELILRGRLFKGVLPELTERHELGGLDARLRGEAAPPSLEDWLLLRLTHLGLEEADELALLTSEDLLPPELPPERRAELDRRHPRELSIGDARYRIAYDVGRRTATLHQVGGLRSTPPPVSFLPRLAGWTLFWEFKNRRRRIDGR